MKKQQREAIYKKAIETWGVKAQLEMLQEEATELALAARKYCRNIGNETYNNLAEEVADVEIMIEQLELMNPVLFRNYVEVVKEQKLKRLEKRVQTQNFEAK